MVDARQHDLEVLGVVELAVLVGIEEFDEIVAICFTSLGKTVLSQKIQEIEWSHEAVLVSVEPLKAAIGLEI